MTLAFCIFIASLDKMGGLFKIEKFYVQFEIEEKMDITGLDKAKILVALYNRSKQQGLGLLRPKRVLSIEEARELLKEHTYFDYLYGTVMKIKLDGNELNTRLYNRDNGEGAAEAAIESIK